MDTGADAAHEPPRPEPPVTPATVSVDPWWSASPPASPPAAPSPPARPTARPGTIVAAVVAVVVFLTGFGLGRSHQLEADPARAPAAAAGSTNVGNAAGSVTAAVVNVNTSLSGGGQAAGTGMMLTSDGVVLTNNHVIDGATDIVVELSTGEFKSAKVLGYNTTEDVAVIKIKSVSGRPTVKLGDSSKVTVGDPVTAIGNALGKGGAPTVTSGIVAALNETITAGDAGGANTEVLRGMIQISAQIQPGDSGGPLVNAAGEVIGMNTAAAAGAGFRQSAGNVAFAIPINTARTIAEAIQAGKGSASTHIGERAILGVSVQSGTASPSGGRAQSSGGAAVSGVQSGSPADGAGIKAGDVITAIGDTPVTSSSALSTALVPYHPGDKVEVTWVDAGGQKHTESVVLVSGPPN
jgi:S1-C subfamily serine protease